MRGDSAGGLLRGCGALALALVALGLGGCGYRSLQQQEEEVKVSWSDVVSQYQRRADLIESLATTVQGLASASAQVLVGASEACARSGSLTAAPAVLNDPAAFASYQASQAELGQALRGLIGLSLGYPQLRSDPGFRDLQAQLADTENRIQAARTRYVRAAHTFNTALRTFPTDMTARLFDLHAKPDLQLPSPWAVAEHRHPQDCGQDVIIRRP